MLNLYRRHNPEKCKFTTRTEKRCSCPIWVSGNIYGKTIKRQALKTRMWGEAEREIDLWQLNPEKYAERERVAMPIENTVTKYLTSCRAEKNVQDSTYISYKKTLDHFVGFIEQLGVSQVGDVGPTHVREFLATRSECTPRTRRKELEHIRHLFNYCVENQWIAVNPAKPIKVKIPKGGGSAPFTDEEIDILLQACDRINNANQTFVARARLRAKALILGMSYTGLRISDMISLKRTEVRRNGDVQDHVMVKTKNLVFTKFGTRALQALLALPNEGEYFLWSGPSKSKLSTATGSARRTLYTLKRATGISVHPRRFRATFALKVLDETGDIRILQHLLGHNSVKTTEESYAYLGPKHRERLTDALSKINFVN